MIINLDMDGVIADFDGYLRQFKIDNSSMTKLQMWELFKTSDQHCRIYRHLNKTPDADELVSSLTQICHQHNIALHILTGIPSATHLRHAMDDKRDWIKHHYPELYHVIKFGPYSANKQWHARLGDVLIDDRPINITQWQLRGGKGIHHTSANNSIKQLIQYLDAVTGD